MELITKRVHTMRTKCEAVSQVTFDEDLNVPDVKPDVGRMIQKKGEIQIDEMQLPVVSRDRDSGQTGCQMPTLQRQF